MRVSKIGGPQTRSRYTRILIVGTLKKGPAIIIGNSYMMGRRIDAFFLLRLLSLGVDFVRGCVIWGSLLESGCPATQSTQQAEPSPNYWKFLYDGTYD